MTGAWVTKTRDRLRRRPENVADDLRAGLVHGLVSVPDGLAAGLLAGLNPIAGLYGYLVGTFAGALATSSVLMSVQATGAMAVLIADVPEVHGPNGEAALVTLGVLTGLVMLALGVLRMGSMVRFVPNAVLTGFVNAVAVNIVLGQLASFTGYASPAANRITRAVDTLWNIAALHWPTVAIGVATIVLIVALERTPLGPLGMFVAVVVTSGLAVLIGGDGVRAVNDIAQIPASLPGPVMPSLAQVFDLVIPAVSLAFVGLVQGAAISQSLPNPDGEYPDVSGDFRGQGIANIASALFRGMPVGGSMSATALVTAAGGKGRLANITASVVMAVVILVASGPAGYIAMPALAGLLMLIGVRTFKPDRVLMVWRTGIPQATVMTATFVLTLVIPLQFAVLSGVAISVVLFVMHQSNKITLVRLAFDDGADAHHEVPPPADLPGGEIVVLAPYGSLFFASAPVLESQLPRVGPGSRGAVVVLRLRGKEDLGSTFITIMLGYHAKLRSVGAHLVLAGIGPAVLRQLQATGALDRLGADNVFAAESRVFSSLGAARRRAEGLLAGAG